MSHSRLALDQGERSITGPNPHNVHESPPYMTPAVGIDLTIHFEETLIIAQLMYCTTWRQISHIGVTEHLHRLSKTWHTVFRTGKKLPKTGGPIEGPNHNATLPCRFCSCRHVVLRAW